MRFGVATLWSERRLGLVQEDEFVPLDPRFGDLLEVIAGGTEALDDVRRESLRSERIEMTEVRLEAPVRRQPRDVLCTGWNYFEHFEEGIGLREGQEVDRPEHPTFFTKGPDTIIGPTDDIPFDSGLSKKWDYEAELALIFSQTGRDIAELKAFDHVWGYLLANDISQRDLQRAHGGQWLKGKSIDATMPIGPVVVTADELDPTDVRLECFVNGERLQDGRTSQMAFSIPQLIAELSRGMTVRAGQLLLTGTPPGVGNARDPQVFLQADDVVVVRGSGIGELRNRLVEFGMSAGGSR